MKQRVLMSTMVFLMFFAATAWGANLGKNSDVPIGTVLDWWHPDATWAVPDGYEICDGHVVTDQKSPLFNMALPDLTDKFVMGITDVNRIGVSGGSASHSHTVDIDHAHGAGTTSSSGDHAHAVDVPANSITAVTTDAGYHRHQWLEFWVNPGDGKKHFYTYKWNGDTELTALWSNGIDDEGTGIYPFAKMDVINQIFYTTGDGGHNHTVGLSHDHPAFSSGSSGPHAHNFTLPPLGPLYREASTGSSLPPYYGLLKIMRIR